MQKARYVAALGIPLSALLSFTLVAAWTGPTQSPPNGNIAAPVNVGTTDQVKNGGFGVNALAVFGNSLFGGSTGSNAYLNFGATLGTAGYGIRDNAGLLEFKNSGGSWKSIQSTVFDLVGGTGSWTASGNNISNTNTGNVGIGTESPGYPLQVNRFNNGPGRVAAFLGNTLAGSGGNAGDGEIEIGNSVASNDAVAIGFNTVGRYGYFSVFGGTRMTLLQNGNVGIGTANPSAKLNIQQGPGTFVRLGAPGYGSIDLGVDNNGSFLIDNSTVARLLTLYTNGNMVITGSLSQNSDARLKTNVTSIAPSTLDQLTSLNPVTFGWLNAAQGTGTQVGFIAQDVQKLFPLLVATSSATSTLTPDGTFTLNYIGFIPYIVESIKELAAEASDTAHLVKTDRIETKELCAQKSDGTDVCVTGDQIAALLAK